MRVVDYLSDDDLAVYLRAVRVFAMLAERSAESVGLTLAQMRLLFTVSDLGVASCSAVAARLHVSVSSVTRLICTTSHVAAGVAQHQPGQRLGRRSQS